MNFKKLLLPFISLSVVANALALDDEGAGPGRPLFLTPYIERGDTATAQKIAMVDPIIEGMMSYSGYITVDKAAGANTFFWAIMAEQSSVIAETIAWFQGGPGNSSLKGLFMENGPLIVNENMSVSYRKTAWSTKYNMIFIDNPVGSGFSFVRNTSAFRKNDDQIADDLMEFFVQYYKMFPQQITNRLYLAGEGYAGKFIPAFAYKLAKLSEIDKVASLGGIMIGNGFSDTETMLPPHAEYLYEMGMLNYNELLYANATIKQIVDLVRANSSDKAADLLHDRYEPYVVNSTACKNQFNHLSCNSFRPEYYQHYVQMASIRRKLHVGSQTFGNQAGEVATNLRNNTLVSVRPQLEYLLATTGVQIMYYTGQLDLVIPVVSVDRLLLALNWPTRIPWKYAARNIWNSQNDSTRVLGYQTTLARQLTSLIVRNAGHFVAMDQPEAALQMVIQFIEGQFV